MRRACDFNTAPTHFPTHRSKNSSMTARVIFLLHNIPFWWLELAVQIVQFFLIGLSSLPFSEAHGHPRLKKGNWTLYRCSSVTCMQNGYGKFHQNDTYMPNRTFTRYITSNITPTSYPVYFMVFNGKPMFSISFLNFTTGKLRDFKAAHG